MMLFDDVAWCKIFHRVFWLALFTASETGVIEIIVSLASGYPVLYKHHNQIIIFI